MFTQTSTNDPIILNICWVFQEPLQVFDSQGSGVCRGVSHPPIPLHRSSNFQTLAPTLHPQQSLKLRRNRTSSLLKNTKWHSSWTHQTCTSCCSSPKTTLAQTCALTPSPPSGSGVPNSVRVKLTLATLSKLHHYHKPPPSHSIPPNFLYLFTVFWGTVTF